jgi:hypothetical protein
MYTVASTTDLSHTRKRPWLAIVLSVLAPGLGHLYLRLWGRALLWFGLSLLATVLVFPSDTFPSSISVEAFVELSGTLSFEASLLIVGVSLLCLIDAYVMARRINHFVTQSERIAAGERVQHCPNCGKELDPEIGFCHWCTTELETVDENEI